MASMTSSLFLGVGFLSCVHKFWNLLEPLAPQVEQDLHDWIPRVKTGRVVAGHDYRALLEFCLAAQFPFVAMPSVCKADVNAIDVEWVLHMQVWVRRQQLFEQFTSCLAK